MGFYLGVVYLHFFILKDVKYFIYGNVNYKYYNIFVGE